jgi:hypothetical protein
VLFRSGDMARAAFKKACDKLETTEEQIRKFARGL